MSNIIPRETTLPLGFNPTPNSFGITVLVWTDSIDKPDLVGEKAYYGCRVTDKPSFYIAGAVIENVVHWAYRNQDKDGT